MKRKTKSVVCLLLLLSTIVTGCGTISDKNSKTVDNIAVTKEKEATKKNPDVRQEITVLGSNYYQALKDKNFFLETPAATDKDLALLQKNVVGTNVSDLELYTEDGKTIKVKDLLTDKPLILKVGAQYCPDCQAFTKIMLDKYTKDEAELFTYKEASIMALPQVDKNGNMKRDVSIEAFLEDEKAYNEMFPTREKQIGKPLAVTEELAKALKYEWIPTYYAINRDGIIFLVNYGSSYEDVKRSALREPRFVLSNSKLEEDKNGGAEK